MKLLLQFLFLIAVNNLAHAQQLVQIGQEPIDAILHEIGESGELVFLSDGEVLRLSFDQLVRWSTAPPMPEKSIATLTDGSRLVLAESWTGTPPVRMTGEEISLATRTFGRINISREQLRSIRYGTSRAANPPSVKTTNGDRVELSNGDLLQGHVVAIADEEASPQVRLQQLAEAREVVLPLDEVRSIELAEPGDSPKSAARILVGSREGDLLFATSFTGRGKQVEFTILGEAKSLKLEVPHITFLQSFGGSLVYLSDLQPVDYRHVPYLEIAWPLERDRSCLGEPLTVGGKVYPKGLGMHSASRVTYELPEGAKRYRRLAAQVAIDDRARRRGSTVFRVYLEQSGEWQLAYRSSIVRGGDPPKSISLELGDTSQIALTIDYADRGDERDYANWLDARLER